MCRQPEVNDLVVFAYIDPLLLLVAYVNSPPKSIVKQPKQKSKKNVTSLYTACFMLRDLFDDWTGRKMITDNNCRVVEWLAGDRVTP